MPASTCNPAALWRNFAFPAPDLCRRQQLRRGGLCAYQPRRQLGLFVWIGHWIILSGSVKLVSSTKMHGQDSHETKWSGPSWVTRHLRDKASPQGVPGRSTGPRKDTCLVGRCLGQTKPESEAAPTQRMVDRCLSQFTRELVTII
jgi:hypothetical protein